MATESSQSFADGEPEFTLPVRKTGPVVLVAIGVVVLGIVAFFLFSSGGKKPATSGEASASASTDRSAVLSDAEKRAKQEALSEHLELTKKALEKVDEDNKTAGAGTVATMAREPDPAPKATGGSGASKKPSLSDLDKLNKVNTQLGGM